MVIHDDDIDFKKLAPDPKAEDRHAVDKLNEDEAPLVADVVDERPLEEIQLEQFRKSNKWKLMDKNKGKRLPHQVKMQYLHFRFHANYFLLP